MYMKKLFLIMMMFLLPLQYTWAMVASYDTHSPQDTQAHFGHHEHQSSDNHNSNNDLVDADETGKSAQTAQNHVHYGFSHLSCGEVLGYELPIFDLAKPLLLSHYLFNHHSPPSYQPERPNWIAPV